jgi:exodeoxyribonuclease V alpha subunit
VTVTDTSPAVALRATGLLATFGAAGVLHAADVHVAQRLGALCGENDEQVLLAVALAVRGVRMGSVTLRLREAGETVVVDRSDPEAVVEVDLPWPEPDAWVEAVRGSVLTRVHDPDGPAPAGAPRPLVMWDDDVWLERYWRMEQLVAADLTRRAPAVAPLDPAAVRAQLERLWPSPPAGDHDPDADQRTAAATVLAHGVGVLGGGPGTGKTTTVARVLCALRELSPAEPRVAVAAPSAKARNRIEESLAASAADAAAPFTDEERTFLAGVPAFTLHKLIGASITSNRSRHHAGNPLPYDVVVLDEMSMVSLSMFRRVLDALRPHARLLLVGDPDQLASVEAGAVLSDLDSLPASSPVGAGVARLQHNHRIDHDRPELAELASAIRRGDGDAVVDVLAGGGALRWHAVDDDAALLPAEVLDDVRHRCLEVTRVMGPAARAGDAATAIAALDRHRLLCAHSRGPRGVAHWNGVVQRWVVDDDPEAGARFDGRYAGMPVMLTVNDYENRVWNGDTGVVLAGAQRLEVVVGRGASLSAPIALTRIAGISTMYATTVHKSQGSEFDSLTLVLPLADSPLATRETLYTAVTRARSDVLVVGSEQAVRAAVDRRALRATGLGRRLAARLAP